MINDERSCFFLPCPNVLDKGKARVSPLPFLYALCFCRELHFPIHSCTLARDPAPAPAEDFCLLVLVVIRSSIKLIKLKVTTGNGNKMSEDTEQMEDSTRQEEEAQSEPAADLGLDLEINGHAQDQNEDLEEEEVAVAAQATVAVVEEEEDEDEAEEEYPAPKFPLSKVKKIMTICLATTDEETGQTDHSVDDPKGGKGTGKFIINKEAVYLITLATEYFVSAIASRAGDITTSSKKKTLSMDFLRRALSDTEAFAFLEGCFQPSIINGD